MKRLKKNISRLKRERQTKTSRQRQGTDKEESVADKLKLEIELPTATAQDSTDNNAAAVEVIEKEEQTKREESNCDKAFAMLHNDNIIIINTRNEVNAYLLELGIDEASDLNGLDRQLVESISLKLRPGKIKKFKALLQLRFV